MPTILKRNAVLAGWFSLTTALAMGATLLHGSRPGSMPTAVLKRSYPAQIRPASPAAAQPLFTYSRDDAAPHGLTRVHIDIRRTGAVIHQNIFGNFIEHLGNVVYPGLWAQVLANPNLEAIDLSRNDQAAPPAWHVNGHALWRPGGKERHGYHSPGYVTLLPGIAGRNDGGMLSQFVHLPAHRVRTYQGSLAVRVLPEADISAEKPPVEARLRLVCLTAGPSEKTVAEAKIQASGLEWSRVTFRFTLPEGAVHKGDAVQFAVQHDDGAPVDVDQIQIFPTDNIEGLDPDVLRRAKAWDIPVLRWPGGNFASGYHWQDGVGPREARPTRKNAAWGGIEPNSFGTDEFLALCKRLRTTPQLTVNAGDGSPEEAAAWVRYCNAPVTDRYGSLRAANGHPKPYGVHLWEVGNELYGDWQIGHTVPEDNARRFVRFRNALLKAGSNLQLISTGKGDEFTAEGMARNSAWNEALLRAAVANGGTPPDYLSIHPLVPLPDGLRGLSYNDQYESAMAHPTFLDRTLIPNLWAQIQRIAGRNSKTRIAITEWGIIVGGQNWQEGPNHDTQAGAVYNALCLNTMLRHSDSVTLANMTAFMHGGGIKKPGSVVIVDPQYWTQQLYASSEMHTPVATSTVGPGADVPARVPLPAVSDVPDVDVFAALDRTGRKLVICAVNRCQSQSRPIELTVSGFHARSLTGKLLAAPEPSARNTIETPGNVAPHPLPALAGDGDKGWRITLPPHSVAILTLHQSN